MHLLLALGSGGLVGFVLGLIGGGGSIVATPLLLYAVGLSPHMALGTGALAVSANAFVNFAGHARAGNVRWDVAAIFSAMGVLGALGGSTLGKAMDGQRLILLFALMMIVVGLAMLRPRRGAADAPPVALIAPWRLRVGGIGLGVGLLSGFFGIGGGFLIVPGLMLATGMSMLNAVGTSLMAVGAFGLATALNYAASGLVDWVVAAEFVAGGIAGGALGMRAAIHLAKERARAEPHLRRPRADRRRLDHLAQHARRLSASQGGNPPMSHVPPGLDISVKPEVTPFFDRRHQHHQLRREGPGLAPPAPSSTACSTSTTRPGRIATTSADAIIAFIREHGLTLEWLIETHVHADHLSAAPYIQAQARRQDRHRRAASPSCRTPSARCSTRAPNSAATAASSTACSRMATPTASAA